MKSASLAEKLEVWGFEDDAFIFNDYSLGRVLRLRSRDVSCSTDEELNVIHDLTCDFINGLETGISIQFVQAIEHCDSGVLAAHESLSSENAIPFVQKMTKLRIARFKELDERGEVPDSRLYLVIRKPMTKQESKNSPFFKFWNKKTTPAFADHVVDSELKSFERAVDDIREGLETLGIGSTLVGQDEAFGLLFDQWNPENPLAGLNFNREDIRDDLILNDMVVSLKGFALGNVHHRVLSLKIMPDQTYSAMSEKLRELPFDSRLFLSIDVLDQDREQLSLETQRRIAYAMFVGKRGVTDLESEAKLRDIEALLGGRVSGQEKIFSVSLAIVLRSKNESELDGQVAQTLQMFRELSGAEGMLESLAAASIFTELALPNARSKERSRRVNTSVLADFLPLFGEWKGHERPRVLLRNRLGGLAAFDPFSPTLSNYGQVISGSSGSGKSFLVNLLVAQTAKENPRTFIVDVGGSYRQMTQNLGGQYIAIGADSQIALNPFDRIDSSDEALDQKIKFLTSLVELMTKENDETGIGKLERSEIEQTIKTILRDEAAPSLTHLRQRLLENGEPLLNRMGKILGPWCGDSPYGKFVDQKTNVALHKQIVCFDLKGLENHPDLQAVCLFLIMDLIWREVQRDRFTPKFIVFDECWRLLDNDAGSRIMGELYRTLRKYMASPIAISQTMEDFASSKAAAAILPNAAVKWILKQTGGNLRSLKEILQLNDRKAALVAGLRSKKGYFSEALLIAGDETQVVVVEGTPLEYWRSTSDAQDLKKFADRKSERPEASEEEIAEQLAAEYPHGVAAKSQ